MGTLTTLDYDLADGEEWCAYLERIEGECRRLAAEGRVPMTDALDGFFQDSLALVRQVRKDVAAARHQGAARTRSSIELSKDDYRRLIDTREHILTLMEILELRGAMTLGRTEGVARMVTAITTGPYA